MFSRLAGTARRSWLGPSVLGGLTAAGAAAAVTTASTDSAEVVHVQHLHWDFGGFMSAYDTASLRRGYEVYRQVCSTCHSMDLIRFRDLVGNSHTEAQAKALAESIEVLDGPNDEGEMFERPGKLFDSFVGPYANDEAARSANNGAVPPDMSCISKARHSGPDYIFHILTGYGKPEPAGWPEKPGLHYNPYFPGQAIAMAAPLSDGQVEYEDDTEATVSQMAKDVVTFLQWCSEPEQDERKKMGFQYGCTIVFVSCIAGYYKRFSWASLKSRRISWID